MSVSYDKLWKLMKANNTKTIIALKLKIYYELSELQSVAQMFTFEYESDSELIFGSGGFELSNFDGSPVVVGIFVQGILR